MDVKEALKNGGVTGNGRDTTYQPKICDSMWFFSENTADLKTSGRTVLCQADYLYYQKKWNEAIILYQKLLAANMDGNTSLLERISLESLSRCYLHKGDTNCALEWAFKLLKHSQSSEHKVVAHNLLSRIYKQAGELSKEAEHLTFCLFRQPLNGFHWLQLGHTYTHVAQARSVEVNCHHGERIPSTSLSSKSDIVQTDEVKENEESDVLMQQRLEKDLEKLRLNETVSINCSQAIIKSNIGKAVDGKIKEERDHNFERLKTKSEIHKMSVQAENSKIESVEMVANGSGHHLDLTERSKENTDMYKEKSLVTMEEEGVIIGEKLGSSTREHSSSNGCDVGQDEESEMDARKFALICYIRARMLFKPTTQSSTSLCNIRNARLLTEAECSIQHLGFEEDYVTKVENLCWKRQFGMGRGEDLEKTLSKIDSLENSLQSNFEKYWFINILNQAAGVAKE